MKIPRRVVVDNKLHETVAEVANAIEEDNGRGKSHRSGKNKPDVAGIID